MAYPYTTTPAVYPYYQPQQPGFFPPQVVQPQQTQIVSQNVQQTPSTNIIWVQDEKGVSEYPVAVGNTVILIDYDFKTAYKKSTDLTGKPLPIEIFDLIPRTEKKEEEQAKDYLTKEEFKIYAEKIRKKIEELADSEMVVVSKKKQKKPQILDNGDVEVIDNESVSGI